jgi:hypothetical protein
VAEPIRHRRAGSTTGAGPSCSTRSRNRQPIIRLDHIAPLKEQIGEMVTDTGGLSGGRIWPWRTTKTPIPLRAARPQAYVLIDISGDYLRERSAGRRRVRG